MFTYLFHETIPLAPMFHHTIVGPGTGQPQEEDAEGTVTKRVVSVPVNFGLETRANLPPGFKFNMEPYKIPSDALQRLWNTADIADARSGPAERPSLGHRIVTRHPAFYPQVRKDMNVHAESVMRDFIRGRSKT